jgi:predicted house-cleaning noncanonical NTP pyrophosphatase (MazG superfamily)
MKISVAFCSCFFASLLCIAQTSQKEHADAYIVCGGIDSIMARKGKWTKTNDDLAFPDKTFPRSQYKFINARIDSMYDLLRQSITDLGGLEPKWFRSIRSDSYLPNGPVPYSMETYIHEYYCNTNLNKILLGDETGNNVHVFVNRLSWFLYQADTLDINSDGKLKTIFKLPPKVGKWKEYTIYELRMPNTNARSIIIGRNGKVPWRSLTQKEYLTGLKNKFQKEVNLYRQGSGFERTAKEILNYINSYLDTAKENTLQQTAIIDARAGIWGFKGKFGNEDAGGFRLVLFAASNKYFETTLPRYMPQLIQLYWSYEKSPASQHFKNQFEENFPIEKLKAMIDK